MRRLVLTVILSLSSGSSFLWIEYALESFSPFFITTARLAFGALICYSFCLISHARFPRSAAVILSLVGAGLVVNALPYTLLATGQQYTSSSIAGLINSTTSLWTLVLVWTLREVEIDKASTVGVLVGLGGSIMLVAPTLNDTHSELWGVLACFAASFCFGLSYIYIDKFIPTREYSLPALATLQLASAAVASLPAMLATADSITHVELSGVLALAILAIVGTGLAYLANYDLIRTTGPVAASVVNYLIPVVAVALGTLLLSESLSIWSILGGVVTLLGVGMTRSRTHQTPPTPGGPPTRT